MSTRTLPIHLDPELVKRVGEQEIRYAIVESLATAYVCNRPVSGYTPSVGDILGHPIAYVNMNHGRLVCELEVNFYNATFYEKAELHLLLDGRIRWLDEAHTKPKLLVTNFILGYGPPPSSNLLRKTYGAWALAQRLLKLERDWLPKLLRRRRC